MPKVNYFKFLILVFSFLPIKGTSQVPLTILEATFYKNQLNQSELHRIKKDFSNEPSLILFLDAYEKIATFKDNNSLSFDSLMMFLTTMQFRVENEDCRFFIKVEKELLLSEFYPGRQIERLKKMINHKNIVDHPAVKTLLITELASNYHLLGDSNNASFWFSRGLFGNFESKGDRIVDNLEDAFITFYGLNLTKEKEFVFSKLKSFTNDFLNLSTEWKTLFRKVNSGLTSNINFNLFLSEESLNSKRFRHLPTLIRSRIQGSNQEDLVVLFNFLRENTNAILEQRHLQTVSILLKNIMHLTYNTSTTQFRMEIADLQEDFSLKNELLHQEYMTLLSNLRLLEQKLESEKRQDLATIKEKYRVSIMLLISSLIGLTIMAFIYKLFSKKDEKLKQSTIRLEEIELKKNQLLEVIKELQDNILDLNLKLGIKYKMEQSLADNFRDLENLSGSELNQIINNLHIQLSNLTQIDRKTMEAETLILQGKKSRYDFKQRLLEKHSHISDNEANLAHYIQLDLNTKEISLATGISIGSVRVYKSKLKSKMGLKVDDDLAAYLKTI